jgi:hypothetical protein
MSRARKIVGLVSAIVIAACVDLSAPKGTPASISQLQLPAFFVVQGDTMRDTLGRALPPTIIAYDAKGGVLTSFGSTFFITDSAQQLHFSAIDSALVASGVNDTAGSVAHVVGQIGSLQTAVQTIYVTVRPDTLKRNDTITLQDTLPTGDDSASSIRRLPISMVIHGVNARPVPGVFVRFTLESSPASKGSSPAAYLTDDANAVFLAGKSAPDTADVSGVVSRTLVLNSFMTPSGKASDLLGDTLVVVATAMYNGHPLQGSPFRVVVPIVPPSFSVR